MASIQARHTRTCALGRPWTTLEAAQVGCTCPKGPLYHVVLRHEGKLDREPVGHNVKVARRALRQTEVKVDEGAFEPRQNVRFREWADEWKASLKRPKQTTIDSYGATIDYANEAFGEKYVRLVGPADIDRFLSLMDGIASSTQAKHLRVLGAMFRAAVRRSYCPRNPIDRLGIEQRPQATKREAAYFEDEELPRIVAELGGMNLVVLLLALKTGMREDELASLTWRDVDTVNALIRVRDGKTRSAVREVDLTPDVVDLLGEWWGECGRPADDALVFSTGCGPIPYWRFTKGILYPALKRAGIDRVGPTGEKRTWHSLRHTYARVALEHGAPLFWLSRQLGHSSVQVTQNVYGHWSRTARKTEAEKLAGAFVV